MLETLEIHRKSSIRNKKLSVKHTLSKTTMIETLWILTNMVYTTGQAVCCLLILLKPILTNSLIIYIIEQWSVV